MTEITPMEAYATSDGKLFSDKIEAQAHQHGLDITPTVKTFVDVENYFSYGNYRELQAIINWEVQKKLAELKGKV
jgi:hypothetical protein